MKQNNTRLIEEVSKLIVNILTKSEGVYLPGIGSLRLVSEDENRAVEYGTEESGLSLVEEIKMRGNCSQEKAQKIYDKWLSLVKDEKGDCAIKGIGKIEGGVFTIATTLAVRLNPKPAVSEAKVNAKGKTKSRAKSRKSDNTAYMITAVVGVIIVAILVIVSLFNNPEPSPVAEPAAEEVVVEEVVESVEVESVDEVEAVVAEEVTPAEEVKPQAKSKINSITSKARYAQDDLAVARLKECLIASNDGMKRFRVVCGVILSPANAGRLVLDVEARTELTPRAYERSGGYMITLFESDDFRPCVDFIQSTASKLYDYTWIYDEKTM